MRTTRHTRGRGAKRPAGTQAAPVRHRRALLRPRGILPALPLSLLLGLALLSLPLHAAPAEHDLPDWGFHPRIQGLPAGPLPEAAPRPADLRLVWFDPTRSLPRGFEALAEEVGVIFRSLGVEVSWRVGGGFGEAPGPEVPVVLLARDPVAARKSQRVLGLVLRDQEPQRVVWVFQENVRDALALGGRREHSDPRRESLLARAVARVAAHEIIHAIAPDEPHAAQGLMRHALDRDFLTAPKASIDARCASAFVARLGEIAQERLARSAAGLLAAGQ